jgi:hypothetical protein
LIALIINAHPARQQAGRSFNELAFREQLARSDID